MFGPHFYVELVRLSRKRWPTLVRVLYLSLLLIGLTVMYRSAQTLANSSTIVGHEYTQPLSTIADRAQVYANILIVLQDLLILLFLPVYVASAISEEKENRTLEILFLSFLTDREVVLGKLGARLLHLGAIVLAGVPLLVFMHLWGNVAIAYVVYHVICSLLILLTGGCICIWISTQADGAFDAIARSYGWLAMYGALGILLAFYLPLFIGEIDATATRGGGQTIPWYFLSMVFLVPAHLVAGCVILVHTIRQMGAVRREEFRRPRKVSGAFALREHPELSPPVRRVREPKMMPNLRRRNAWDSPSTGQASPRPRTRGQRETSQIHPLALPIGDTALFWKECLKDGTSWSLRGRWVGAYALMLLVPIILYRALYRVYPEFPNTSLAVLPFSFTYAFYFVCMAAYGLVVVFQTTLSVAGEREQDTIVFLQLIPEDRTRILFFKWLGPLWRNWPILAIGYLGVLLGLGCGLYPIRTALVLCVFPWPLLLMLSLLALCLSVWCRRVLYANMALTGFFLFLVICHVVASDHVGIVFVYYAAILFGDSEILFGHSPRAFADFPWTRAFNLACFQQCLFLLVASVSGLLAYLRFRNADHASA